MFRDIVIPQNNEAEFISVASKLGIKRLYFLYDFDKYNPKSSGIHKNVEIGFLVNQKNANRALKESRLLAVKSSDNARVLAESKKIKLIYGLEEVPRKDYLHQRASGLNHILCNILSENNVSVGFSYSSFFNKSAETRSVLMGRMMQNISLCKKYKVKTVLGSFSENPFELRATHDVISFFNILGMDSKNTKKSLISDL